MSPQTSRCACAPGIQLETRYVVEPFDLFLAFDGPTATHFDVMLFVDGVFVTCGV